MSICANDSILSTYRLKKIVICHLYQAKVDLLNRNNNQQLGYVANDVGAQMMTAEIMNDEDNVDATCINDPEWGSILEHFTVQMILRCLGMCLHCSKLL